MFSVSIDAVDDGAEPVISSLLRHFSCQLNRLPTLGVQQEEASIGSGSWGRDHVTGSVPGNCCPACRRNRYTVIVDSERCLACRRCCCTGKRLKSTARIFSMGSVFVCQDIVGKQAISSHNTSHPQSNAASHTGSVIVLVHARPEGRVELGQLPFQAADPITQVRDALVERQHSVVELQSQCRW
jgi:hypothetical protein